MRDLETIELKVGRDGAVVCRVDVSALLKLHPAELAKGSRVIVACPECAPGTRSHRLGTPKPFCMRCGRDLSSKRQAMSHGINIE